MALKAYALSIVSRFKTFAKITGSDNDTILEILINQVTEFVEKYCGRRFKQTAYTGTKIDSDGGEALQLPQYPVISTSTFTLYRRTTSENEDSWETIDSEDYYVDYTCGLIYRVGGEKWLKARQRYKVDYTAGFDFDNAATFLADTTAGDVELACWKLVKTAFDNRAGSVGVKSESIADYSVTFREEVFESKEIKEILDSYKIDDVVSGGSPNLY